MSDSTATAETEPRDCGAARLDPYPCRFSSEAKRLDFPWVNQRSAPRSGAIPWGSPEDVPMPEYRINWVPSLGCIPCCCRTDAYAVHLPSNNHRKGWPTRHRVFDFHNPRATVDREGEQIRGRLLPLNSLSSHGKGSGPSEELFHEKEKWKKGGVLRPQRPGAGNDGSFPRSRSTGSCPTFTPPHAIIAPTELIERGKVQVLLISLFSDCQPIRIQVQLRISYEFGFFRTGVVTGASTHFEGRPHVIPSVPTSSHPSPWLTSDPPKHNPLAIVRTGVPGLSELPNESHTTLSSHLDSTFFGRRNGGWARYTGVW